MRSSRGRLVLDVLVMAVLAVGVGGNLAAGAWSLPGWLPSWVGWGLLVTGVPLLIRRFWPMPAYIAGLVLTALTIPLGGPAMAASMITAGCALYIITAYGDLQTARRALFAGLIEVVVLAITFGLVTPDIPSVVSLGVSALVVSYALGHTVRGRHEQAERERETHTRQAVADERLRIAREMHDVVAHSMSLIAVKAAVGNHVAAEQPEQARDALRVIEDTSRETLAELRRMLGVLRSGTGEPEAVLGPAPTLADLQALAERTGQAGISVDLDVEGLTELPGGVGQSVYRITQEALTNVVKHAGARTCRVRVCGADGEVSVEVVDDGHGAEAFTPGHGVIGMRERVAVYGGEFSAAPTKSGFRVFARLPYESVAP
ncbi:MAG TPA: sensor histidine kinase [Amycolatopsis sp.]|nr:sensor histidine kinase [Amycolatopsis sp.]